jgi:REP element-mobilizing transposase RayT
MLGSRIEKECHAFIERYCNAYKGARCCAVGGTPTHVHLAVQVAPTICPSEFIGKVKGASSHEINVKFGPTALAWQHGYGVVSFARRDLPAVEGYVRKQKEHHANGTTNRVLETVEEDAEVGTEEKIEEGDTDTASPDESEG